MGENMSLFNRVSGLEFPKIAIWQLITDMTRVLDTELSFEDFVSMYNMTPEESYEANQYLTRIGDMVQERTLKLINNGIDAELSTELARSVVFVKFWHALIRCEKKTITEQQFKQTIGIPTE